MATKKTKETTYTKDQVRDLVADTLTEVVIRLKDPSLVIVSVLAMEFLDKNFK